MPEHPEWMDKHSLLSFEALYAFASLWWNAASTACELRAVNPDASGCGAFY